MLFDTFGQVLKRPANIPTTALSAFKMINEVTQMMGLPVPALERRGVDKGQSYCQVYCPEDVLCSECSNCLHHDTFVHGVEGRPADPSFESPHLSF